MRLINRHFLFIIAAVALLSAQDTHKIYRDVLYLQNGEEKTGYVAEITDSSIKLETPDSAITFDRKDVLKVSLQSRRKGDWWRTKDDIDDALLDSILSDIPGRDEYPYASFVTLYRAKDYTLKDGHIILDYRLIGLVLDERGKDIAATHIFTYFPDMQNIKIKYARTISSDGRLFHLDDAALEFSSPNGYLPAYDRIKRVKFALGEVKAGSVIDVEIEKDFGKPDPMENPFYATEVLRGTEPVRYARVTFELPSSEREYLHTAAERLPDSVFTQSQTRDRLALRWEMRELKPVIREPDMPPMVEISPLIMLSFGPGWNDIGRLIRSRFLSSLDDSSLAAQMTDSICKDASTPIQRVKYIYRYVAERLRFMGPSPSDYHFFPRRFTEILANGYGNAIDKNYLFWALLYSAGFHTDIAFANAYKTAFSDSTPSLGFVRNPVIVVNIKGKRIYLSPLSEYNPFGHIPLSVQGRQFLLVESDTVYIKRLPMRPAAGEAAISNYNITLADNGDVDVVRTISFTGGRDANIRKWKQKSEEQLKQDLQESIAKVHPAAELVDYTLEGIDDILSPVHFELHYKILGYALSAGKYLSFKFPEFDYSTWGVGKPTREYPIHFVGHSLDTKRYTVHLPKGFYLYHKPENRGGGTDSLLWSATFDISGGKIILTERNERIGTLIPPNDYPKYREYRQKRAELSDMWIVLSKDN